MQFSRVCALIHPGRVGSTALGIQLSVPPLVVAGEIFNTGVSGQAGWAERMNYVEFLQWMIERSMDMPQPYTGRAPDTDPPPTTYLFEFKPFHYGCDEAIGVALDRFADCGVSDFVLLIRENYLRRYVSYLISQSTGVWHTAQRASVPVQVHVETDAVWDSEVGFAGGTLLGALDNYYLRFIPEAEAAIVSKRSLKLTYEHDIEQDPSAAYVKVRQFLGLAQAEPRPCGTVRQNSRPLREIISNYDEVAKALAGSRYSHLLDA